MWPLESGLTVRPLEKLLPSYDYIVVGGKCGNAGCVIARRLAENKNFTVLLVEKGDAGDSWLHRTPMLSFHHWSDGKHSSVFESVESAQLGRSFSLVTGSGLGGSTRINGDQYTCGTPAQFNFWDEIAQHSGWSYSELKPFFSRSETFIGNDSREFHGSDGPVEVRSFSNFHYKSSSKAFDAAQAVGFQTIDDMQAPLAPCTGVNKMHFTIKEDGTRSSSFRSYLPASFVNQASERLHICTETVARKLCISPPDQGLLTVTGVELEAVHGKKSRMISAGKEVILACGALYTPQLLLLSGVGPKEHLTAMGIPVLKDLPGVGMNLQDHLFVPVSFYCPLEDSLWAMVRRPMTLIKQFYKYLRYGEGWLLGTMVEMEIFASSDLIRADGSPSPLNTYHLNSADPKNLPDVSIMSCSIADPRRPNTDKSRGFFGLNAALLRPKSVGSISLTSKSCHSAPRCDLNLLSSPEDWKTLRRALKVSVRVADQIRQSGYALSDLDVPNSLSDVDLDNFIRERATTMYHYSSTCRMAPENAQVPGVVDAQLRVYGTANLRICDASVFPDAPGTHPQALVYAFAEKCVAMINRSSN